VLYKYFIGGFLKKIMKRIVVAGGGPAGFMAAVTAAESARGSAVVEILDAGEPLATLLRTGGGRCNLTNDAQRDRRGLAACYPRGEKFLLSVFSRFDAKDAMEWFASRGLPLAVEKEGRVFPASRRAVDASPRALQSWKPERKITASA
jgi:predicted flavoprotein YhiN